MPLSPQACAEQHWDVIVIGTGMGGAAFGWAIARAGRRVLFCEQGQALHQGTQDTVLRGDYAERLMDSVRPKHEQLAQAGRWSETLLDATMTADPAPAPHPSHLFVPFIGAGTGGSTALYGMVLERFQPHDFAVGGTDLCAPPFGGALPHAWPFSYADLQPYYVLAERCFGLHGGQDPLRADPPEVMPSTPLTPAGDELRAHFCTRGLHPYSPPLACRLRPGCRGCQGYLCDRNCKRDSATTFLLPALQYPGTTLLSQTRAVRLDADAKQITGLRVETGGQQFHLHADRYALGAGALATPRLLLASYNSHWPHGLANQTGLVGRGLMRHLIDLYAVFTHHRPAVARNLKELAFNDWYTPDSALGSVQSFGPLPPPAVLSADLMEDLAARAVIGTVSRTPWLHTPFKHLIGLGTRHLRQATLLATTLEDYARAENRLRLDAHGRLQLTYRLHHADHARVERFRGRMRDVLAPYHYTLMKQAHSNKRLAHVCGTCRLGRDPESGVLDAHHQAYGLDNLLVIDGAALPVSGGTNPGLTICATALRAADILLGDTQDHTGD